MKRILLLFPSLLFSVASAFCQHAVVTCNISNANIKEIKCSLLPDNIFSTQTTITIPVKDGQFHQSLSIKAITFLAFEEGTHYYGGFIEPGDSINITYDAGHFDETFAISGRGAAKLRLPLAINRSRAALSSLPETGNRHSGINFILKKADSINAALRLQISENAGQLSSRSRHQLAAYLEMTVLKATYNALINFSGDAFDKLIKDSSLTKEDRNAVASLLHFKDQYNDSYFYISCVAGILNGYYNDNLLPDSGSDIASKYKYLSNILPPRLKSPVLFLMVGKDLLQHNDADFNTLISSLFAGEDNKKYQQSLLHKLMGAGKIPAGMPAPDFTIENVKGEKVHLRDFSNKVILIDFWFAACGPCHEFFRNIKNVKHDFIDHPDVVFLTISVDNRDTWEKALAHYKMEGYHAFTENKYREHPMIAAYHVTEYPTVYLIGKNGKIAAEGLLSPADLKTAINAALAKE